MHTGDAIRILEPTDALCTEVRIFRSSATSNPVVAGLHGSSEAILLITALGDCQETSGSSSILQERMDHKTVPYMFGAEPVSGLVVKFDRKTRKGVVIDCGRVRRRGP